MNNGGVKRIKYYSKQVLTVRDFQDQQEYHRQKQKSLLKRFPHGILTGLDVKKDKKDSSDPNDFDGILIETGLAVDSDGNEINVPEEGYKVPFTDFKPEKPYLSLVYTETEALVGDDPCSSNEKNNRIKESFTHEWDKSPNMGLHITVALIKQIDGQTGQTADSFDPPIQVEAGGGPRIRLDASLVGPDQIQDSAITETHIRPKAVSSVAINDGAVDETKLSATVVAMLMPGGLEHNHFGGDGGPIPKGALEPEVRDQLVPNGIHHKHDNDDGDPIPTDGIANRAVTSEKLSLTIIEDTGSFSIGEVEVIFPNITPNAIIQVIPVLGNADTSLGALSWSYTVEVKNTGRLDYKIKIRNRTAEDDASFDTVHYKIRAIVFSCRA